MSNITYIEVASPTLKDIQVRGYWLALRPTSEKLEVWVRLAPPHREYSMHGTAGNNTASQTPPYVEIEPLPPTEPSNPWIDSQSLEAHIDLQIAVPNKQVTCEELLPIDRLSDPDGSHKLSWIPDETLPIRYVYGERANLGEYFTEGYVEVNFYGEAIGNITIEAPLPSTPLAMCGQAVTIMTEHWNKYGELLKTYFTEGAGDNTSENTTFGDYLKRLRAQQKHS